MFCTCVVLPFLQRHSPSPLSQQINTALPLSSSQSFSIVPRLAQLSAAPLPSSCDDRFFSSNPVDSQSRPLHRNRNLRCYWLPHFRRHTILCHSSFSHALLINLLISRLLSRPGFVETFLGRKIEMDPTDPFNIKTVLYKLLLLRRRRPDLNSSTTTLTNCFLIKNIFDRFYRAPISIFTKLEKPHF